MMTKNNRSVTWMALMLVAAMTFGVLATASAQGKPLTAEELTDKVQDFYKNITDYQARFEQTYTDMAAGKESKSGGKVFFKKPGKMRWDYLTEGRTLDKVLVSDGKAFTIYEAEYQQYYRQCLKDSALPTALRFLMGTGDLRTEFNVAIKKSKQEGTHRLELTPKKSSGKYKKVVFIVDANDFSVRESIIYDPYNNTNRIVFVKPSVNKSLPDAGFDFTIPQGVRPLHDSDKIKCE